MDRTDERTTKHLESIEALADAIRARLRRVCTSMSDDEFDAFVADIAAMQACFAEIETRHMSSDPVDRTCENRLDRQLSIDA